MRQQSGDAPVSGANMTNVRIEPSTAAPLGSLRTASVDGRLATGVKVRSAREPLDANQRHQLIAVAAYYRAEARGFAPGFEIQDWLAAERALDL
jgi:hypothetical protein